MLICFVNDAPSIENSSGPLCCLSWIGSHVCMSSSSSDNDNQAKFTIQHVQTVHPHYTSCLRIEAFVIDKKVLKISTFCNVCDHRGTMMKMMIRKRKMVLTCSSIFHCTSCLTPPTLSKTFLHRISHISPIKDPVRYLSQPI